MGVTLIELGRHDSNVVFINLRVLWISCEIWSLNVQMTVVIKTRWETFSVQDRDLEAALWN